MKLDKLAPKYATQLAQACHRFAAATIPGFKGSSADVDMTAFKTVVVDKIENPGYQMMFYSHVKLGVNYCECEFTFNGETWSFWFPENKLAHFVSLGKGNVDERFILKWAQTPITDPLLNKIGITFNISKPARKNTVN